MPITTETLTTFDESLARCGGNPAFLERFYAIFLNSSEKVRQKFVHTDFTRQKLALRMSLNVMRHAAEGGPEELAALAERHSSRDLDIGAELYDLWLDSLLKAVEECDPLFTPRVAAAWEVVMMVGMKYLLEQY